MLGRPRQRPAGHAASGFVRAQTIGDQVRGYFAIGAEGISKAMNVGSLWRTAHAFGASFMFTVGAVYRRDEGGKADTSDSSAQVPLYHFTDVRSLVLPRDCRLVGVEVLEGAIDLPAFHHPRCAAYVFGPERASLSPVLVERCEYVVRIPARFALNVAIAGALVMYDRMISLGRFAPRPARPGGPGEDLRKPVFGGPFSRRKPGA